MELRRGIRLRSSAVLAVAVYLATAVLASAAYFEPFNVSYDHRAILIGGERRMLVSAGVHYPRATPQMWPSIIAKSKEGGADLIQTYVFWSGHEPTQGQYYFEERYDLVKFVKLVAEQGLYLNLRIGPYVCAEWNFGGFPVWLRDIPGIEFRTDNEPFKEEMQKFVTKIVDMMKEEELFSWQGGPIILAQIENEYGNIEASFGQKGKSYIKWAADMALGLGANVPWIMCKQSDAPQNIINTCNAFYCDGFKPNLYGKPTMWTEDWNGWFASWGGTVPHRPVQDNSFALARFFQRGGSFHNYYMYFGGTNFGRTSGGPNYITSYDYDAPIDEYGLLNEPKWGHLKDLHATIKLCETALITVNNSPQYVKLGPNQEAHIYASEHVNPNKTLPQSISICSLFIANIDEQKTVSVKIFGKSYNIPPWSVTILPDCKNIAYNTAKVVAQTSVKSVEAGSPPGYLNETKFGYLALNDIKNNYISNNWMSYKEQIGAWGENSFTNQGILEHLNVTKDISDYLWYITRFNISEEDFEFWKENGTLPSLVINKTRDVVRVYINGQYSGSKVGNWVPLKQTLQLVQGINELVLLSETVGLQNYGAFLEKDGAGFRGEIKLTGFKNSDIDLSKSLWTYQVGLKGEYLKIYTPDRQESTNWTEIQQNSIQSPFTWYKALFDAPKGTDPVSLDLGSMGKGQAWINGIGIGRFWSLIAPKSGCSKCDYRGAYTENKCVTNCGLPTQSWYHIPREWLKETDNLLVLFEETGGDPTKISLHLHFTKTICSQVTENDYPPLSAWSKSTEVGLTLTSVAPQVYLHCDDGHVISNVVFASYGTPKGSCEKFLVGKCHAESSVELVTEVCLGKNNCTVSVTNSVFGDPCRGKLKKLAIQAECSSIVDSSKITSS
ncbi:hypothetical protein LUZ60_007975 [Juncus effusus]|nr:hypothetical protein LUZ60_007975 [Juncus effusus]